ncbi:MAG TPA: hypothetical protein VGB31_07445 [Myxococcota bacterium]
MSNLDARRRSPARLVLVAAVCAALSGCVSPVRAVRVDHKVAHQELTRSAVTTNEPSWPTRDALLERGLLDAFAERPEATLADLHRAMVAEHADPPLLFALAELSFLHGQSSEKREYQLAAVIYAHAFLFPDDGGARPDPFDPRLRIAADLYNWSLTAAFASDDRSEVLPRGGDFELPFGEIAVAFDPAELRVGNRELYNFVPSAELEIHGLSMRYRWPGIGAPLAASTRPAADTASGGDMVAPRLRVPVTALLRVEHARRALVSEQPLEATLELHLAWEAQNVAIAGESVPLESEPTAALALTFTGVPIAQLELFGFLGRLTGLIAERPPLVSTTPYRPGLVPVVFVHGTASSPVRWVEMYNRLHADPEIRSRFQFWFFQYESNQPIALSALRLREAIGAAVSQLDPEGEDPALREMVLIGHSQGGLLVKMQSIDSGDRLWNAVSRKPLDELRLSDTTRDLIQRGMFVEPLPEVSRVVFIATPHRGSFLAARQAIVNLLRWLTRLPLHFTALSLDVARNLDAAKTPFVPTAVDNMSPRHPFILSLQQIPIAPSVAAHSIIAVKGDGPAEEGNDGGVEFKSAQIDGVESELVVRSPHSCQGNPHTMEEVRRILRLHVGLTANAGMEQSFRIVESPEPR